MVRIALTTAFVASLVLAAIATPVERVHTVPLKKVGKVTSAKSLLEKDLRRYKSAATSSGAVENDLVSYTAPIKVGSQTFDLIVDTGSSNTWVGANTKFSAGTTGKSTGKSVSVSYGSGSFSGTEYTDAVTFAGLTVSSQSIGVASTSSGFSGVDGIFGVGPVGLTQGTVSGTSTVPTFLDNLFKQGQISTEVLGVSFKPESGSDQDDVNGELTLGGTDSSKYSGSITYTPTLSSGSFAPYWGITVSSIKYGSTSVLGSNGAIVDTGTTLIYIPTTGYNKFLSAAGGKTDSSSGLAKFMTKPTGNLVFSIGGTSFTLTPAQYLVPTAEYSLFGLSSNAYYSWVGDGGSSGVDFIVGQKFLENYYSVFDTTNGRVGFATRT